MCADDILNWTKKSHNCIYVLTIKVVKSANALSAVNAFKMVKSPEIASNKVSFDLATKANIMNNKL